MANDSAKAHVRARLRSADRKRHVASNQPIENVMWPASLVQLEFGMHFDQPIENVTWPSSLRQLTFGHSFNRGIEAVAWPSSLEQLAFGTFFNQPLGGIQWPPSLRRFRLTERFRQSLRKLGTSMPALEQFTFHFPGDANRYGLLRDIE